MGAKRVEDSLLTLPCGVALKPSRAREQAVCNYFRPAAVLRASASLSDGVPM